MKFKDKKSKVHMIYSYTLVSVQMSNKLNISKLTALTIMPLHPFISFVFMKVTGIFFVMSDSQSNCRFTTPQLA